MQKQESRRSLLPLQTEFKPPALIRHLRGCQWQHVTTSGTLRVQKGPCGEALSTSDLSQASRFTTYPSEKRVGLRNTNGVFLFGPALAPDPPLEKRGEAGFALACTCPARSNARSFDVDACLLQQSGETRFCARLKRFAQTIRAPSLRAQEPHGFWRFLTLRHSAYLNEWMVNVVNFG